MSDRTCGRCLRPLAGIDDPSGCRVLSALAAMARGDSARGDYHAACRECDRILADRDQQRKAARRG